MKYKTCKPSKKGKKSPKYDNGKGQMAGLNYNEGLRHTEHKMKKFKKRQVRKLVRAK